MAGAVVKIDAGLKKEVEKFLSEPANRLEYPTLKHFVNKAILRYLWELKEQHK